MEKRRVKKRRQSRIKLGCLAVLAVIIVSVLAVLSHCGKDKEALSRSTTETVGEYAKAHSLSLSDWPDELLLLYDKNPDAREFVLSYPEKKDKKYSIDLGEYRNSETVPLLMQWDERWGYSRYSGELFGLSGCGPTCLSMVHIFLRGDTTVTPRYVADFAERKGYSVRGSGSSWSLISEGGRELGLEVKELPLHEGQIKQNLLAGRPIICVMGPGDFTQQGHFIVLAGYENGLMRVNDPNSPTRSEKLWSYEEIKGQIKNLWVCK